MNKCKYILFFISFIFSNESPLLDNYHTYSEIQEKLTGWDELYGNSINPQPNYYNNSGIIYKLEEIGTSNTRTPFNFAILAVNSISIPKPFEVIVIF